MIQEGIADPLRRIAADRYPPLLERLAELGGQLAQPARAVPTQAAAVAQIDAILVEMRGVLDKMLELETFNEVVDLLRTIIDSQEELNTKTKDSRKSKLRDLLE